MISRVRFTKLMGAATAAASVVYAASVANCDSKARSPIVTEVYTWGSGNFGQLGHGVEKDIPVPTVVSTLTGKQVTSISSNGLSTACVTNSGDVYTFGCSKNARLGHGDELSNASLPRQICNIEPIAQIATGEFHMAAITKSGKMLTWGKCASGQCAHKRTDLPMKIEDGDLNGKEITAMECGRQHTVALSKEGLVYSFGYGYDGALGHDDKNNQKTPKLVAALQNEEVVDVSCGRNHTLLVTKKGDVYACGANDYGQLGVGNGSRYERKPKLVSGLSNKNIVEVAAGEHHSIARSVDGSVFTWGSGKEGQLCVGDRSDTGIPRQVQALSDKHITGIAAGGGHSAFVTRDGELWIAGRGRNGQIGRATKDESVAAYRTLPVKVDTLIGKHVLQVSLGADHSVALVQEK